MTDGQTSRQNYDSQDHASIAASRGKNGRFGIVRVTQGHQQCHCLTEHYSFWATACKTVRPMLSDRCLSCLSICDVGVLSPNGWMDQDETWHAGHIVLDGDPAPPPPKGHSPPIFGPYLLWPNGCMDQDATWYGGRPRSRRLCVRCGPRSTSPKEVGTPHFFSAHIYCGQTAGWIKMHLTRR